MRSLTKLFVVLLFLLILPCLALAQNAYRWYDRDGNEHYGTNPPKNALEVKRLSGRTFSKYSSERMFKAYSRAGLNYPQSTTSERQKLSKSKSNRAQEKSAPIEIEDETSTTLLEQGGLNVEHNSKNQITKCAVGVRNAGKSTARNVIVAFEFEDGTLIPGVGSDEIKGNSEELYEIPEELLPISVKQESNQNKPPLPKVSIQAAPD